ncbi:hypothetical protein QYE76_050509 [Lolium multiflorum]|uniref:Retrotransposon gag domain-containing protein n=1 Tax=Lolium multiflorum TaxID=4521 RepID=A0AAD8WJN3_LOLMU|nr:hypothetical protein QYE76_050509 [Lolium multiflorum]
MAQAHRGALESLAILGNNLVPPKEKTTVQGSGSKHHARDARDEITQSKIDKARRRRAARKDDDSDSSDEDQEYDGELRGADCLSYKIREAMPPKKFKPTPTDAAKYDGQQEPRSWIDDYLQTVILHKGNQIAAMQCLQLYLKDSARAWLRGLPKGSVKSWDDLVDAFVANFQATYKRPVGIKNLRNCRQKRRSRCRTPELPYAEQINAPCYLHSYVDSKDGKTKSSHLLRDCRQFLDMHKLIQQSGQQQLPPPPPPPPQHQVQQAQPHQPNEAFPPPRGQMSMIHRTGVSKREMKKLTREINLAESIMANIPEYNRQFQEGKVEFEVVNWESQYHAILGRPAYAKFMAVPHYAYLKLKMPGNNGTNITVYGSFSRSDNCDHDFQRIAAKFGPQQEIIDPPPKLSLREIKEEKDGRETKKKPAALALKASAAEASAAEASAAKGSAVDGTEGLGESKTMATTAQTPDETSNAAATTNAVKKPEEEKNPFLA